MPCCCSNKKRVSLDMLRFSISPFPALNRKSLFQGVRYATLPQFIRSLNMLPAPGIINNHSDRRHIKANTLIFQAAKPWTSPLLRLIHENTAIFS
jgi:hypothetical protein